MESVPTNPVTPGVPDEVVVPSKILVDVTAVNVSPALLTVLVLAT